MSMVNSRQQWDRDEDRMSIWAQILYKYGVPALIAVGFAYLIGQRVLTQMDRIEANQMQHNYHTSFYLRQMCLSMSLQAGRSEAFCDPEHAR